MNGELRSRCWERRDTLLCSGPGPDACGGRLRIVPASSSIGLAKRVETMSDAAAELPCPATEFDVGARLRASRAPLGFWATTGIGLAVLGAWQALQVLAAVPFVVGASGRAVTTTVGALAVNPEYVAVATVLSAFGGTVLVLLFARGKGGSRLRYLAMRRPGWRETLLWTVAAILVAGATGAVGTIVGRPSVPEWWLGMYAASAVPLLLVLAVALAAPVFEEALFRGLLFPGWSRSRLGAVGTILLTAALWAAVHLQYDAYDMGQVFLLGLLLGVARHRSGSLVVPLAMHVAVNAVACLHVAYVLGST